MAAVIGSGMVLIDATAVNVALPFMQQELSATAQELQWIIESYTLFLSALILLGGALGDRYGRRKIFALGFAIFTAASLGCAIAPNIAALIGARCVQGVGAALATPGSLALISAAYSGKARGNAIGIWSAASGMAGAAAPLLGGWLTQVSSWRAIFLINLPLGAAVLAVTLLCVAESRDEESRTIDVAGALLSIAGLAVLVYGLILMQTAGNHNRNRRDRRIFRLRVFPGS